MGAHECLLALWDEAEASVMAGRFCVTAWTSESLRTCVPPCGLVWICVCVYVHVTGHLCFRELSRIYGACYMEMGSLGL